MLKILGNKLLYKNVLVLMLFSLPVSWFVFTNSIFAHANPVLESGPVYDPRDYETEVLAIVQTLHGGDMERALALADTHIAAYPKSRVGHLLKADILQAMAFQLRQVGEGASPQSKKVLDLKHQIRNRWRHLVNRSRTSDKLVPASLISMGDHKYVMVADQQAGRLFLYRNQDAVPVLEKDYYLTLGSAGWGKQISGDLKTPIGIYAIYKHIAAEKLPDLYGSGAFPVDYPNQLDRYRKRTGYGIWLHGTPSDTYARAPWASEGCFVLSNADLLDIQQYIDIEARTPVILSEQINWVSVEELQQSRAPYLQLVADWKRDRTNPETQAYLTHYVPDNLNFGRENLKSWSLRHDRELESEELARLELDVESLFLYPGESDMFLVKYRRRLRDEASVEQPGMVQYWQKDGSGQWKILYEG